MDKATTVDWSRDPDVYILRLYGMYLLYLVGGRVLGPALALGLIGLWEGGPGQQILEA